MKPTLITLFSIFMLIVSCSKENEKKLVCAAFINPISFKFNLIDKDSKADLFFAENPKYQISDLKIYRTEDVSKKPLVITVNNNQGAKSFKIDLDNGNVGGNTLVVEIGSTTSDMLKHTVKKSNEICASYIINEVRFNETLITPSNGVYTLLKQSNSQKN